MTKIGGVIMGEARRRKLAGIYPTQPQPLSRADAIAWAWNALAASEDDTVSGVTIFPRRRLRAGLPLR
jgi:hypothetical protein